MLHQVFDELHRQRVVLEGMILKPNMILPGLACITQESVNEVADATVRTLLRVVPASVPGIAFLSGGAIRRTRIDTPQRHACALRFPADPAAMGLDVLV